MEGPQHQGVRRGPCPVPTAGTLTDVRGTRVHRQHRVEGPAARQSRFPCGTSRSLWDRAQLCRQLPDPGVCRLPPGPRGRSLGLAHASLHEGPASSGPNLADRAILSPRPAATLGGKQEAPSVPCSGPSLPRPGSHATPVPLCPEQPQMPALARPRAGTTRSWGCRGQKPGGESS